MNTTTQECEAALTKIHDQAAADFDRDMPWLEFHRKYMGPDSPTFANVRPDQLASRLDDTTVQRIHMMAIDLEARQKQKSGRFNLRIPGVLHQQLAEWSQADGLSLNSLCARLLQDAVKRHHAADGAR